MIVKIRIDGDQKRAAAAAVGFGAAVGLGAAVTGATGTGCWVVDRTGGRVGTGEGAGGWVEPTGTNGVVGAGGAAGVLVTTGIELELPKIRTELDGTATQKVLRAWTYVVL